MKEKWISVKDRLPDTPGDVLVYRTYSRGCGSIWIYSFQEINGVKTFCFWDNENNQFIPTNNVTHWMPLPMPPTISKLNF